MKYTNKFNFPEYVVEWLSSDFYDYDENTLSATTLMQPARMHALKKKHYDQLEIDVSDVIASRYGTAIHDSVEKVNLKGCIQEQRLRKGVMNKIITGKFDILREIDDNRHELIDIKSTSVWSFIYGSNKKEHVKQLSIYRWLANNNDYTVVQKAKIWMVFTDWSAAKAKADPKYPQTRIEIKEVDLWSEEETLKYMGLRIKLFNTVAQLDEKDMPLCTEEELWADKEKWAIMKEGNKRAFKVFEVKDEAWETHAKMDNEKYNVVHRPGGVKRCKYCLVRKFCSQYKQLVESKRIEELK